MSSSCCGGEVAERKEFIPRPSCIDCVEKHLGAASVLLSEIHVGYEYNLFFIGHLHEAEDESRQFPELCKMIRHARVNWQKRRIVPIWSDLAREISNLRGVDYARE